MAAEPGSPDRRDVEALRCIGQLGQHRHCDEEQQHRRDPFGDVDGPGQGEEPGHQGQGTEQGGGEPYPDDASLSTDESAGRSRRQPAVEESPGSTGQGGR